MRQGSENGYGSSSLIGRALEKHWSALPVYERLDLLRGLGIDGKNEEILGGRNITEVLRLDQDYLPSVVRGKLILSLIEDGFSAVEYNKVKESMRSRLERV